MSEKRRLAAGYGSVRREVRSGSHDLIDLPTEQAWFCHAGHVSSALTSFKQGFESSPTNVSIDLTLLDVTMKMFIIHFGGFPYDLLQA